MAHHGGPASTHDVAGAGAALQGYVLLRMYLKPHERESDLPVHDHWGVAEDAEATADAEEAADIAKAAAEADGGIAHKGNDVASMHCFEQFWAHYFAIMIMIGHEFC